MFIYFVEFTCFRVNKFLFKFVSKFQRKCILVLLKIHRNLLVEIVFPTKRSHNQVIVTEIKSGFYLISAAPKEKSYYMRHKTTIMWVLEWCKKTQFNNLKRWPNQHMITILFIVFIYFICSQGDDGSKYF